MEKLLISVSQQMFSSSYGAGPLVSIEEKQTKPEAAPAFTEHKSLQLERGPQTN